MHVFLGASSSSDMKYWVSNIEKEEEEEGKQEEIEKQVEI